MTKPKCEDRLSQSNKSHLSLWLCQKIFQTLCITQRKHNTQLHNTWTLQFRSCAANWYAVSLRARKLLFLMLMRCEVPCQITAGKMSIMSLRNFSTVRHWFVWYKSIFDCEEILWKVYIEDICSFSHARNLHVYHKIAILTSYVVNTLMW